MAETERGKTGNVAENQQAAEPREPAVTRRLPNVPVAPAPRSASATGKDGYPPEWHTLKHEVRKQAGYRCIRCLHPYRNGEQGKGEWTTCDAACTHGPPWRWKSGYESDTDWHEYRWATGDGPDPRTLNPRRLLADTPSLKIEAHWRILTVHHLDGDKTNLRWWNLAALCQRCHLEIQGRVKMERRWPHEHSDWFKPYVAGYYAHVFLDERLTREEVEARLDELLALEDRQLALGES